MVVVSEGVKLADGRYVCELTEGIEFVDAFGQAADRHGPLLSGENQPGGWLCKTSAIEFNSFKDARPILSPGWISRRRSRWAAPRSRRPLGRDRQDDHLKARVRRSLHLCDGHL